MRVHAVTRELPGTHRAPPEPTVWPTQPSPHSGPGPTPQTPGESGEGARIGFEDCAQLFDWGVCKGAPVPSIQSRGPGSPERPGHVFAPGLSDQEMQTRMLHPRCCLSKLPTPEEA